MTGLTSGGHLEHNRLKKVVDDVEALLDVLHLEVGGLSVVGDGGRGQEHTAVTTILLHGET